jgi:parvulin-like peptidyl-prolyl isomerase
MGVFVRQTLFLIACVLLGGSHCARLSAQPLTSAGDVTPIAMTADTSSIDGCQVVARVEGQAVLACEVLWKVNKIIEEKQDQIPPEKMAEVRQMLIQQAVVEMIDRKIIYSEFRRNVPAENIPHIEEQLLTMFEKDEVPKLMEELKVNNQQDLEKELVRLGSSLADVRRTFNEKAIVSNWVRSKVKFDEDISPDEMLTYYHEHVKDYDYPTQVRWEELMVRKDRFGDPAKAWEELAHMGNEVCQRAAAVPGGLRGPAFVEMAKARSDGFNAKEGGQHDWTPKGALKSAVIEEQLFQLQVGQLSDILTSDTAFHIVRVLERRDAGRKPFADVQADIRDKLKEGRREKAIVAYLERMRTAARVWTEPTGDVPAISFIEQAMGAKRR